MNRHLLKRKYMSLYDKADKLFKKHKPCQHDKEGRCEDYRNCSGGSCNCCCGCEYLGPKGCTVKSLACKLWYCNVIYNEHPQLREELDKLKHGAQHQGIAMGIRQPYHYTERFYLDWFINRQKELKEEST